MEGDTLLVLATAAAALDQGSGRRDRIGEVCICTKYLRIAILGGFIHGAAQHNGTYVPLQGLSSRSPKPGIFWFDSFILRVWLGRDIPTGSHESYATFGSIN
jgi:hypothetical protein